MLIGELGVTVTVICARAHLYAHVQNQHTQGTRHSKLHRTDLVAGNGAAPGLEMDAEQRKWRQQQLSTLELGNGDAEEMSKWQGARGCRCCRGNHVTDSVRGVLLPWTQSREEPANRSERTGAATVDAGERAREGRCCGCGLSG